MRGNEGEDREAVAEPELEKPIFEELVTEKFSGKPKSRFATLRKKIVDHFLKRPFIPSICDLDTEICDKSLFENMKNLVNFEVI